jgi:hypothetical protein
MKVVLRLESRTVFESMYIAHVVRLSSAYAEKCAHDLCYLSPPVALMDRDAAQILERFAIVRRTP